MNESGGAWLVAGLGNPGPRHAGTRHDLGFMLVERLARAHGRVLEAMSDVEWAGPFETEGGRMSLVRPLLYMNRSGPPLQRILAASGLPVERLIVACDDMNLPLGRLRIRPSGSAGGHNGLKSIIASLGTDFPRLRMGVGAAPVGMDPTDWVLGRFTEAEMDAVNGMLERAETLVREVVARDRVIASTSLEPQRDEPGALPGESGEENE